MCGIAAVFGCREEEGRGAVARLLGRMRHRGEPEFQNEIAAGPGWAVGTNRLAIATTSDSRQPVVSHDGTHLLVFNGEIYAGIRDVENRGSAGYRTAGGDGPALLDFLSIAEPHALDAVEGMFAFVLVRAKSQTARLGRDRLGIKPLYYGVTARRVVVSSELKAIAPEEDVLDISVVLPGCTIDIDFSPVAPTRVDSPRQYFDLRYCSEGAEKTTLGSGELLDCIRDAIAVRAAHDQAVGVYTSGGVDSSAVLWLARDLSVDTVPIVVGALDSEDGRAGRDVCEVLGLEPILVDCPSEADLFESALDTVRIVESFEPNLVRQSSVQRVIAGAAASAGLKVILCGEGADELFCGYPEFLSAGEDWAGLRVAFLEDLHRTQLQRVDRMSMHFTTEVRVPFLDGRIVKAALRDRRRETYLAPSPGLETKAVLREAMQGLLPERVRLRPKVVLSEGVGLRGNAPMDGMFAALAADAIGSSQAAEVRRAFPEWNLRTDEEAFYFREFDRLGYTKASFMRKRVCANTVHSVKLENAHEGS